MYVHLEPAAVRPTPQRKLQNSAVDFQALDCGLNPIGGDRDVNRLRSWSNFARGSHSLF